MLGIVCIEGMNKGKFFLFFVVRYFIDEYYIEVIMLVIKIDWYRVIRFII